MSIFGKYVDELLPKVPTILRRKVGSLFNITMSQWYAGMDAVSQALVEFVEVSYPLATASGWLLDEHWGPYTNIARNGQDDTTYRLFIRAKRLLNRSWGAADQALVIFQILIPGATLEFIPEYPKAWIIKITGVDIAATKDAINFMTKQPSPLGGGFSVCGDNGLVEVSDAKVFSYTSVYGTEGVEFFVTGWFDHFGGPPPPSDVAGYASVKTI